MPKLSEPLHVKEYTLRNRLVFPPMQSGRADFDGSITPKLVNFYVRRSTHIGLPIVEHAYIDLMGKIGPKQLGIYADSLIPGYEKLATALHSVGVPAVVQISHAGGVANKKVIHNQPAGPSSSGKTRMLEICELDQICQQFAAAAKRAIDAGFDGVELHGAHGYLLNQFFSPLLNKRVDKYGGDLQKRMRFPLEVSKTVRHQIGPNKLLLYRLGSDDLAPYGIHVEDAIVFAQKLVEIGGVDILDVSGGMCGSNPKQFKHVQGYFIPQAMAIKQKVTVPVIGVGGITEPKYANTIIQEEKTDLVAIGRALWKDAQWAQKALENLN
ncbi:MAG: NADH:flavin oxidoreductase [Candidatus Bathyarchaeota archaeon]|uniref:NADH:flavin oxidoreductase n=1 Tax=Candidatus Bathycorpusculum sp. TaxID=2994959 RepID=UPI0028207B67|nr:NADH:flavin oxidoreductase [Candidatus Termiticorpusculum sp.]MCL2293181.1 NADH:flavin oxidoreductase [Candidatus Termiticorpusculum sp.]